MEPRAKGTDFEEILNRSTIPGKITMNFLEGTHPENLPVLITDFVLDKTAKASPIETINILKSLPLGLRTIYILVRFEDSVNQKGFYNTFKEFQEHDGYLLRELFSALKVVKARESFKITKKAFLVLYGLKGLFFLSKGKKLPDYGFYTERKRNKLRRLNEEFYIKSTDLGICEVGFIINNKELFIIS